MYLGLDFFEQLFAADKIKFSIFTIVYKSSNVIRHLKVKSVDSSSSIEKQVLFTLLHKISSA